MNQFGYISEQSGADIKACIDNIVWENQIISFVYCYQYRFVILFCIHHRHHPIFSYYLGLLIEIQMKLTSNFQYIAPILDFPNVILDFLLSHCPHAEKDLQK